WFVVGGVGEVERVLAEALRRLRDDFAIGKLVAERTGHHAPDLVAKASHGVGNRDDAHRSPPPAPKRKHPRRPVVRPTGASSAECGARSRDMIRLLIVCLGPNLRGV